MKNIKKMNRELASFQLSDHDLKEIIESVKGRFDLYFSHSEAKLLQKIATPQVVSIMKDISKVQFTSKGELSIDSLYVMMKGVDTRMRSIRIRNPFAVIPLFEKLAIIYCYKLEESEDLSQEEKALAVEAAFSTLKKLEVLESVNFEDVMPTAFQHFNILYQRFRQTTKELKIPNVRKPLTVKLRSLLQKECGSKCPLCSITDVDHFQAHHIDGDRSNTIFENLLLICPTCHSKIEKGDITRQTVELVKRKLKHYHLVEIYKIDVDSEVCNWNPIDGIENAFELVPGEKSPFPLFQISFINHHSKTIVLKDVELNVKHLYSGLSGFPTPMEVPTSNQYQIIIQNPKKVHKLQKFRGIQIGPDQAYMFQVELLQKGDESYYTLDTRMTLNFVMKFSNEINIELPIILINTHNESDSLELIVLD